MSSILIQFFHRTDSGVKIVYIDLPEIEESINKSSFICIDGEFTGKGEHSELKGLYQFLCRVTQKG